MKVYTGRDDNTWTNVVNGRAHGYGGRPAMVTGAVEDKLTMDILFEQRLVNSYISNGSTHRMEGPTQTITHGERVVNDLGGLYVYQEYAHRDDGPAYRNQCGPLSDKYENEWYVYGISVTQEYNNV